MASDTRFVAPPSGHPNEFVMRLVTFLGADFSDTVNDFLAKNATRVTVVEEGEEHSLESYAVFREYLDLLEVKLQAFMTSEGMNEETFHAKVAAACVEEDVAVDTFISALVASWEYETFLTLVREYIADEAAMDVVEDVMGMEEEEDTLEDDVEGGAGVRRTRGGGEDEDFSAFM